MRWIALLILAFVAAPTAAYAQGEDTKEQAKAAFMKGREAFAAGQFKDALDNFEKANQLRPHPLMVYNIAQVYETMGDLPGAIAAYQQYLESKPDDAADVKKKIKGFEATVATWPKVALTSVPPGATVWVEAFNARPKGTTPLTMPVPPKGALVLAADGHEPLRKEYEFAAGSENALELTMVKILPYVQITSEPTGAAIAFDGQAPMPGGTPIVHRIEEGKHTLTLTLDGYEPFTQEIELLPTHTKAAPLVVNATLEVARPKGQLVIEVDVPAAKVLVNGESVGESPLPGPLTLDEGVHRVRVEPTDGEPYEETVSIKANETTTTEIDVGPGFELNQRFVSYILMGVGGAALIGGGVVALGASGAKDDFDACDSDPACSRTPRQVDLADDVRSQALTADILLGVGVAAAATGVVLFFLDGDEDAPAVGVIPTEGGAAAFGVVQF